MHARSADDREFQAAFETCRIVPADFRHRAHLRLAYCYLTQFDAEAATDRFRSALARFISANDIDPSKYSETLTQAWVLAVHHFMRIAGCTTSADDFLEKSARLLDRTIMLTHYAETTLDSAEARVRFVEPDRLPIPRHGPA